MSLSFCLPKFMAIYFCFFLSFPQGGIPAFPILCHKRFGPEVQFYSEVKEFKV